MTIKLDIKDAVALDLVVTSTQFWILSYFLFVNLKGFLDRLRQLDSKLVSLIPITRLELLDNSFFLI